MRRTKIICTMGPNTDNPEIMKALIENGMNVARFNFSHGDYEEQKNRMNLLKKLRAELNRPVAILLDTKGPEIRTGVLVDGKKVKLEEGQTFTLTTEEIVGDNTRVSVTYDGFANDLMVGNRVLIDDGLLELLVTDIKGNDVICKLCNSGELGERKGINLPDTKVNLPGITEKDRADIIFGIEQDIDFIAASFIRDGAAVREIKELCKEHGREDIDIISKVENRQGLDNIDEIIKESDGIMVARGDMGVEIPAAEVPFWQRTIIEKVNHAYKPVIVATQMLDSMIRNPRPTRAEVSDVANAVMQSTDAVMLSGETANGKYPVEALKSMAQICEYTESKMTFETPDFRQLKSDSQNTSSALGAAAVATAANVNAACILTPTMSGQTPRLLCNFRPEEPIYAVTPNERAARRMMIDWGVTPLNGYDENSTESIVSHAMYVLKREKVVEPGETVVVTAGDPAYNLVRGKGNKTNMMYVIQAF